MESPDLNQKKNIRIFIERIIFAKTQHVCFWGDARHSVQGRFQPRQMDLQGRVSETAETIGASDHPSQVANGGKVLGKFPFSPGMDRRVAQGKSDKSNPAQHMT